MLVAVAAITGCASLNRYSVREAEASCSDLQVCTVDGPKGRYLSPCTSGEGDAATIYPGDPAWPYTTPGVCDAVKDGKVVSTRLSSR